MKRKTESVDIIPKAELAYRISQMKSLRDQALASFIYMSGCRISEILGTTKDIKRYVKENGKYKLDEDNHRVYIRQEGDEPLVVKPLTKESIEILEDKQLMLIHNVPNLKRIASLPRRTIPVYIPIVAEFFQTFYLYYKSLEPGQILFDISRQRAWQIMYKELHLFNHFFIHERCTHLVAQEGFTDLDLKQFRGWSSSLPANVYTHLRWQDLARKQGANVKD